MDHALSSQFVEVASVDEPPAASVDRVSTTPTVIVFGHRELRGPSERNRVRGSEVVCVQHLVQQATSRRDPRRLAVSHQVDHRHAGHLARPGACHPPDRL